MFGEVMIAVFLLLERTWSFSRSQLKYIVVFEVFDVVYSLVCIGILIKKSHNINAMGLLSTIRITSC